MNIFKWLMLRITRFLRSRSLPKCARSRTHLQFRYSVMGGGCDDRVTIFSDGDGITLTHAAVDEVTEQSRATHHRIEPKRQEEIFLWLRNRLSHDDCNTSESCWIRHAAVLELFAKDFATDWECSIEVSGVQGIQRWRSFRYEFLQMLGLAK